MIETLLDKTHKLKLYLVCRGITAAEFARSIGYTPQMITGYLRGTKKLSRRGAVLIQDATMGFVSKEYILMNNPICDDSKKILEVNAE